MQIIIFDITYDRDDINRDQFLADIKTEVSTISKSLHLSDSAIPMGADWPIILVTIGGLFFLGKPINENLKAWIELSRKFVLMIKRIKRKFQYYRFDEYGATLLAIQSILKNESNDLQSIEKVVSETIPFLKFEFMDQSNLDSRPDVLYLLAFLVNNKTIYLFGIRSLGKIDFKYVYNTDNGDLVKNH